MISVGEAMISALEATGVRTVFGIPGTHNLELYRGLAGSSISHVVTRHEQGAGYAADGYARVSGRPGVVITTSGPGLTNVLTSAATAYADSVAVLVVSSGPPLGRERANDGWLHEVKDQQAAADAVFERSIRPATGRAAVEAIHSTFERWHIERRRPVHIEVPLDVLESSYDGPDPLLPRGLPASMPPAVGVADLVSALSQSRSVAILAGGGAIDAADEVRRLAEALGAPVVTTTAAKGLLGRQHPLSLDATAGFGPSMEVLTEADLLLVVGSELGDSEIPLGSLTPQGRVARIDLAASQLQKNLVCDLPLLGDARSTLAQVLDGLEAPPPDPVSDSVDARVARAREAIANLLQPPWRELLDELDRVLPPGAVIAGDSSQICYFGAAPYLPLDGPRQYLVPIGYSTLGYGLPAAIGAKLASPQSPVMALLGDGAVMFSVQELMVAVELGLTLPVLIVDNGGFAEIREGMEARGIPPLGVNLRAPDFVGLGRAMGCAAQSVNSAAEAAAAVAAAFEAIGPTVISFDVRG